MNSALNFGSQKWHYSGFSCISIKIFTPADDKGDNDITEERDDDRLFDLFFDGERERDLVLWRPRLGLDFFPVAVSEVATRCATKRLYFKI